MITGLYVHLMMIQILFGVALAQATNQSKYLLRRGNAISPSFEVNRTRQGDNVASSQTSSLRSHVGLQSLSSGSVIAYVGTGAGGYADGSSTSALFTTPQGVYFDPSTTGTNVLYVADWGNNFIRKVDSSGIVSTVATPTLMSPADVFLDTSGNIYIADEGNNVIRMVAKTTSLSTIVVGTVFSTGAFSGDGGAATSARLNHPTSVVVDTSGNIYVADQRNNRVRFVSSSSGIISTFAGSASSVSSGDSGSATSAGMNLPIYIALDAANGFLYIAEANSCKIRRVALTAKTITTVAGTGTPGSTGSGGLATLANLGNYLQGIKVDTLGNLYIADISNNVVWCVEKSSGKIQIIAGVVSSTGLDAGDNGPATSASFNGPSGLAVDSTRGYLYVTDTNNNRVRMVDISNILGLSSNFHNPTPAPSTAPPSATPSTPSSQPTRQPTGQPSRQPTSRPSSQPTRKPSGRPSRQPTSRPTAPTSQPTIQPSSQPSRLPTRLPTTQPSSQPTSSPSCTRGHVGDHHLAAGCQPCPAGHLPDALGGNQCVACPATTYQPHVGGWECMTCPYPSTSNFKGQPVCMGFCLCFTPGPQAAVMTTIVFIFVVGIALGVPKEQIIPLFANVLFPSLDFFSDIAYLITNSFSSSTLFTIGVIFVSFPVPLFLWEVFVEEEAYPDLFPFFHVFWILYPKQNVFYTDDGKIDLVRSDRFYYPSIRGERRMFSMLSMEDHSFAPFVLMEVLAWVLATLFQLGLLIPWIVLVIIHDAVFLPFWLCVGVIFHATKIIAIGRAWNLWFRVWTRSTKFDFPEDVVIDTYQLNACLFQEFFYESLPQLVLQSVNNTLTGQWTPVGIFSIVQTVVMTLNALWRFVYLRYCKFQRFTFDEIPIDMTVDFKGQFGLGKIIELRVPPATHKKSRRTLGNVLHDLRRWIRGLVTQIVNLPRRIAVTDFSTDDSFKRGSLRRARSGHIHKIDWEELELDPDVEDPYLGQGSFGLVFRGLWRDKDFPTEPEPVAVKVISKSACRIKNLRYQDQLELAKEEAKLLEKACSGKHGDKMRQHISVIYGYAEGPLPEQLTTAFQTAANDEAVGIVMRLEMGGSVERMLYGEQREGKQTSTKRVHISMELKIRILLSVSNGLRMLHERGIIHGDLKPGNVLLDEHDDARISDFGLSKQRAKVSVAQSTLHKTKTAQGTEAYMAPEMTERTADGLVVRASRSTDMYAFAIMAWEIMVEKRPPHGERPSLRDLPPNTPLSVRTMMEKCWDNDRNKRWTAVTCYATLQQVEFAFSNKVYDIFLSHRWVTKPLVEHLYSLLVAEGYRVWIDKSDMGLDLVRSMQEGIQNSVVVVACIDSAYQNVKKVSGSDGSNNCMLELRHAHKVLTAEKGKHSTKAIIACVLEDGITWGGPTGTGWASDEMRTIIKPSFDPNNQQMWVDMSKLGDPEKDWKPNPDKKDGDEDRPTEKQLEDLRQASVLLFDMLEKVPCPKTALEAIGKAGRMRALSNASGGGSPYPSRDKGTTSTAPVYWSSASIKR